MNEDLTTTYSQRIYELTVRVNLLVTEKSALEKKVISLKRSIILVFCFSAWSVLNNPFIFQWHHV